MESPLLESPAAARRDRRRWWVLAAALTVQVTVSGTVLGFPALVPFVKSDLHLSVAQAGVFATVPGVGGFLMLTTIGWAVDRFGDRFVLFTGGMVTGLVTGLAALAGTYPLLLVLLALVGAGSASPTPAGSNAIMKEFSPRRRGLMISVRQTGIPIGGAIAAIALPPLAIAAGWRRAMLLAGLASVLGALACLAMYRRAGSAGRSPVSAQASFRSVLSVLSRDLTLTACSGFVLIVAQFCVLAFLVLYLHATWRIPVVEGSLLLAATQLVGAAARIAWGWVSDRLFGGSRKRVLVTVSLFAAAAGMALAALPDSATGWLIVPVVLAFGAGALGWNGIYITLLAELGRPGFQGRSVALGLTLNQLGIVLGPWLFGTLVDTTGSFRLTWALVAVALLGAAALVAPVREIRRA